MKVSSIKLDSPDQLVDQTIAWLKTASREAVDFVLSQKIDALPGEHDGRSDWFWLRLTNGDLFLCVAPHGETYLHVAEGGDAEMTYP